MRNVRLILRKYSLEGNRMTSLLPGVMVPSHSARLQHLRHLHKAAKMQALTPSRSHTFARYGGVANIRRFIGHVLDKAVQKITSEFK